jgi:hypothetical protein
MAPPLPKKERRKERRKDINVPMKAPWIWDVSQELTFAFPTGCNDGGGNIWAKELGSNTSPSFN